MLFNVTCFSTLLWHSSLVARRSSGL